MPIVNVADTFKKAADLVDSAAEVYTRPNVQQNFDGYYHRLDVDGKPVDCFCILAAIYIKLNDLPTEKAVDIFRMPTVEEDMWDHADTPSPEDILAAGEVRGEMWLDSKVTPAIETIYTSTLSRLIGEMLNDRDKLTPAQISAKLRSFAEKTYPDTMTYVDLWDDEHDDDYVDEYDSEPMG